MFDFVENQQPSGPSLSVCSVNSLNWQHFYLKIAKGNPQEGNDEFLNC